MISRSCPPPCSTTGTSGSRSTGKSGDRSCSDGRSMIGAVALVGRDLHDAERRAIGPLPDELGVEREAARGTDLVDQCDQLGAVGQERRFLGHGGLP